jgi:hypothetical protein
MTLYRIFQGSVPTAALLAALLPFSLMGAEETDVSCRDAANGMAVQEAGGPEAKLSCRRSCPSYKEFVTVFNYLVQQPQEPLTRPQAAAVALKVIEGCKDSAERFIRVFDMMRHAGLTYKDALRIAQDFGAATAAQADAFVTIFRTAFSRDQLDLPLQQSIDLAKSLSLTYQGKAELARNDFAEAVKFCLARQGLAFSRPQCAELATKVARASELQSGGAAAPFIEVVNFLRDDTQGPGLPTFEAHELALALVAIDVTAAHNFIQAYKFVTREQGLKLNRNDGIAMARKIAAATKAGPEPQKKRNLR